MFYQVSISEAIAPGGASRYARDDLFSVSFPTEKDGWASGRFGTVVHTSDGGITWHYQETKTDYTLASISFSDTNNGWAVGDEGTIIHTKDGGKTWVKQKSPVAFFLMGVHFANAKKGWAVTERTNILSTEDGGTTWKVQFSDADFILKSVSFCDDKNGWAVGEYGFIYHTGDGGKTWRKQAGEFRLSEETGEPVSGSFLFSVYAENPQTAWAVGIEGYVTRTQDGGKTWNRVSTPPLKAPLFSVAVNKKGIVALCGDGVFLQLKGSTWTSVRFTPSIKYSWLYGLAPQGNGSFVAVGQAAAIYVSDKITSNPGMVGVND